MNRAVKKYAIVLAVILFAATGSVFWISFLKSHRISQPQGNYMAREDAKYLETVLDRKNSIIENDQPGSDDGTASTLSQNDQNSSEVTSNEWYTYGEYLEWIEAKQTEGTIPENIAQELLSRYEGKYQPAFFMLEQDFIQSFTEVADRIDPENPIHIGTLTWIAGGVNVSHIPSVPADQGSERDTGNDLDEKIISAADQNLKEDEILTEQGGICKLSLRESKSESEISQEYFRTMEGLMDDDAVYYVRKQSNADLELNSCFTAKNDGKLLVYWSDYGISIPNAVQYDRREDIVDLSIKDGQLANVRIYQNKVHGKLLRLGNDSVELAMEDGTDRSFAFTDHVQVYRLYGDVDGRSKENGILGYHLSDLKVGYDFTDFVLNDEDQVVAALATREETMSNIRVLIRNNDFADIYHDSISLCCDTACTLKSGAGEKKLDAGESITIDQKSPLFENERLYVIPSALTSRTDITSLTRGQGTPSYRGSLEIVRTDNGLLCINELLLEEYLYSVVPSEMPSSYPLEAQKAQAISARTYAYRHMTKSSLQMYGAHVDDSTGFQVYNNIEETDPSTQAVRETKGKIVTIDGEVAGTYFYSTSCGFGTDTSVWHAGEGENTNHLHAKAIAASTPLTPELLQSEDVFEEFIRQKQPAFFESEEGWFRWTYETKLDTDLLMKNLRKRFETYPEQILTLQKDGNYVSQPVGKLGRLLDIRVNKRLAGGVIDELDLVGTKHSFRIISERNVRGILANQSDHVVRQTGDTSPVTTMLPSAFAVIECEKEGEEVTGYKVIGGGYGHGIGLSQNGAKDMAEAGYSCGEIMQFFYEGIKLEDL
ncbi:MAG: SpoIID/LytB domain-containing protein [Lachnospiraceae bacterium]|jgi:stage II sporulation protein D|nr:SpoIID/LytB domain-containing protein [Lachnospiraceae bacterium]